MYKNIYIYIFCFDILNFWHLGSLGENFLVNDCGMYDLFLKYTCACVYKFIFRTNHTYTTIIYCYKLGPSVSNYTRYNKKISPVLYTSLSTNRLLPCYKDK